MKYKEYIDTKSWNDKSIKYLKIHPICEICHKYKSIEVHHNSYENIGNELDEDLTAICHRCHYAIHSMPPKIDDKVQLQKSLKIMKYFRQYPSLKTIVLNKISNKYFDSRYMLDVSNEECPSTAFFVQNILEIFYDYQKEYGVDLIEETLASCIKCKIDGGNNSKKREKEIKDRTKKYQNTEYKLINKKYEPKKSNLSKNEKINKIVINYCLYRLSDKDILKEFKSIMNVNYYEGKIYFNNIGIKTAPQFLTKIKKDGLLKPLFIELGGTSDYILSKLEDEK